MQKKLIDEGELEESNVEEFIDLNDLRVFAYVATLKGFSLAADKLKIHKSSVSRIIARLEAQLNTPLLERTTRKVQLTLAGAALKDQCIDLLDRVGNAFGYIGDLREEPHGNLTIGIPRYIGLSGEFNNHLLPNFLRLYQGARITLRYFDNLSDLDLMALDLTIAEIGTFDFQATYLGSVARCICASPDYLKSRELPDSLQKLVGHGVIVNDFTPDVKSISASSQFERALFASASVRLNVNDLTAAHQAILKGMGIGCLPWPLCRDDVKGGRLITILPDEVLKPIDLGILHPTKRYLAPIVQGFVAMLQDRRSSWMPY